MKRALGGLLLVFASLPGLRSQAAAPVSTVLHDVRLIDVDPDRDIADVDKIAAVWHRGRPVAGDLNSFTP